MFLCICSHSEFYFSVELQIKNLHQKEKYTLHPEQWMNKQNKELEKNVRICAIWGADYQPTKMEWLALHLAGGYSALHHQKTGPQVQKHNPLPSLSTLCTSVDLPKIWGKNSKGGRCRVSQGAQPSSWGGHWPLLIRRGVERGKQHGALITFWKIAKAKEHTLVKSLAGKHHALEGIWYSFFNKWKSWAWNANNFAQNP